ncbi:MAG: response regulator [Candidatus Cloacimonadaceae bacterium]|jgi:putative two-component system response regulator|nr:response regulator [Candidatus Cloacimonadaceae bacterium]
MSGISEQANSSVAQIYQERIDSPHTDALTGLVNHGYFYAALERDVSRAKRHGASFALGVVDVDSFSLYNKSHGRIEGDRVLKAVSNCIQGCIRTDDLAARYREDVFAVIFTESDAAAAFIAAERIRTRVNELENIEVTVSIGLADYADSDSAEGIVLKAKSALKKARLKGKNQIAVYAEMEKPVSGLSAKVLVVDDLPMNLGLMEAILRKQNYEVVTAESGIRALEILSKTDVDLILLDVMMPEMDGYETCRKIKSQAQTRMVPVILVTGLNDHESRLKGIDAGADDFISKPPNVSELVARTKSLIRIRQLNRSLASIESVLFSMAKAVEAKDKYTQGHIERVAHVSTVLGRKMGMSEEEIKAMEYGGILHDIGKIGIPNEILNKPGPLTSEEREIMETHADLGYQIGLPLKANLGLALQVIRHHHEKLDGSGYPDGLTGEEIPMVARIVGVVDIFDALVTDRPYRKGMRREKAFMILREEAANKKIDATIVEKLISYFEDGRSDFSSQLCDGGQAAH